MFGVLKESEITHGPINVNKTKLLTLLSGIMTNFGLLVVFTANICMIRCQNLTFPPKINRETDIWFNFGLFREHIYTSTFMTSLDLDWPCP